MENTSTFEPNAASVTMGQTGSDAAKQQIHDVTQQAKAAAGNLAEQARTQVKSQLSNQKDRAAESLGGVADALRQTGDQLNQHEQPLPMGRYAEQAAEVVEQVAGYLRTKEIDEIVGQAENLARQRPAVFLGAAFAVGFMAARFLKSSDPASRNSGGTFLRGQEREGRGQAPTYSASYYQERESIREAELHEQRGYPLKTAYERAEEVERDRNPGTANTERDYTYGGSRNVHSITDMAGDLSDDESSSDFAEATRMRPSDA